MTRIAIVTGAARGIGAATAQRLAADGHAVAVLDLDEAHCATTVAAITDAGGRALAVGADVADAPSVEAAVARVTDELGAPTILVNNAGIIRDNLLFKMTEDDWDAVMSVHLRGAFLMSRAVQAHQVKAGWGRIVNQSPVAERPIAPGSSDGDARSIVMPAGRPRRRAPALRRTRPPPSRRTTPRPRCRRGSPRAAPGSRRPAR